MKLVFSAGRPVLRGHKLILSVGENLVLLHARYKLLTAAGYGAMSATGGLQAMTMFGDHPIDLVLLDYPLPDIDGGMVAESLKEYEPMIPIIMVSEEGPPRSATVSTDVCLRKSEGAGVLLKTIRELMASSVQMRVKWRRPA